VNILQSARVEVHKMFVMPAEAGIQRLKSLDPGLKPAEMTIKWDSNDVAHTINPHRADGPVTGSTDPR
jgi:hypothetical protein